MLSPPTYLRLLRSESSRLREYLVTSPADAWTSATACDRWQVRDVVAHLAGAADAFADRIGRALVDDVSAPEGLPAPGEVNATSWSETNARRWIGVRERMGDRVLANFGASCDRFQRVVADLRPEDWNKSCYHPGGVVPVRTIVGFRLLELAVHGWDIRSRLEPSAHLSTDVLPALVEFVSEYLEWFFNPGTEAYGPVRYRFGMGGVDVPPTDIIVTGNTCRAETLSDRTPDVTFRCDAEVFIFLMCGRTSVASAKAREDLRIEGSDGLAELFGRWFQGA